MEQLYIGAIIGIIIGFFIAVKIGAGGVTNNTENSIGKIKTKGDESPIDTSQINAKEEKKRGLLKRIFTKNKKNEKI